MSIPVTVYTKERCVQCVAVKRWLTQRGIPFEERDAMEPGNLEALKSLNLMAAPVIAYGDEFVTGFDPNFLAQIQADYAGTPRD